MVYLRQQTQLINTIEKKTYFLILGPLRWSLDVHAMTSSIVQLSQFHEIINLNIVIVVFRFSI